MKTTRWLVLLFSTLILGATGARSAGSADALARSAQEALERFQALDSTLAPLVQKAAGYVVFPRVAKGGLVFGGAKGEGLVYEKGRVIGRATLAQATFGAQIGGQVFREIILFETPAALEDFKLSKFEMNAQAGAVAAAEGLAKNARYTDGVLVFTQPLKGLMAEASVGGQKFTFQPLP